MVVGYIDAIDGCTNGSVDRITDKQDVHKNDLKDNGEVQENQIGQIAVPEKILDICCRTTTDKDQIAETVVDVSSSCDESTAECYSSSDDESNALDTFKNNQVPGTMTNELNDCKDFWVAKTVNITNNYQKQTLDVEQLKYLADECAPKISWTDGFHNESIGEAQDVVSHRLRKAVAIGLSTLTLVLVVIVVAVELWQLNRTEAVIDTDNQYHHDVDIFGPTAPANITLVPRQTCDLVDPKSYIDKYTHLHPSPTVLVAHTVTSQCFTREDCCQVIRNIQSHHMGKMGWSDIGYHFLVGGDGRVYEGKKWDKYGIFLIGYNCGFGVAFIGDFTAEYPRQKQLLGAEKLLDELEKYDYLSENYTVYGAKQLSSTESPGTTVMEAMKKWPHAFLQEKEDREPPCTAKPKT